MKYRNFLFYWLPFLSLKFSERVFNKVNFVGIVFATSLHDLARIVKASDRTASIISSKVISKSPVNPPKYLPFLQVNVLGF